MEVNQERVHASIKETRAKQASGASKIGTGKMPEKKSFLDITTLVRSIQRAEGNVDCFRTGQVSCDHFDCAWRPYCLEGHQTSK